MRYTNSHYITCWTARIFSDIKLQLTRFILGETWVNSWGDIFERRVIVTLSIWPYIGRKLIEPDWRSERSQKLIWPDRRWRFDLICSSKLIKSDQWSEKPRQLIRSDRLLLQLSRGHSDGQWLRPMFIPYFTVIYL